MQSIDEFVTGQLAAWEVPGCAVAAVRDGDVVVAAGRGHRDQAAETPVTKDTLQGDHVLTVASPGNPPLELEPGRGLRFGVKDQPAITVEFELDDSGAVTRLVAQPLGIFPPK